MGAFKTSVSNQVELVFKHSKETKGGKWIVKPTYVNDVICIICWSIDQIHNILGIEIASPFSVRRVTAIKSPGLAIHALITHARTDFILFLIPVAPWCNSSRHRDSSGNG